MSPDPADRTRLLQYWDYLEVPKLLSLQSSFPIAPGSAAAIDRSVYDVDSDVYDPADDHGVRARGLSADELFFISIHQSFEVWFQCILAGMDTARDHLEVAAAGGDDEKHLQRVVYLLERGVAILRQLGSQIELLGTLPGREFFRMRTRLGTSSGFESYQFRMLERHLGMLYPPVEMVSSPPAHHGIIAFISQYRDALKGASGDNASVDAKVGADLFVGTALEGQGDALGSVEQRQAEIDAVEDAVRCSRRRRSVKDAWFLWLQRRVPLKDADVAVPALSLIGVLGGVLPTEQIAGLRSREGGDAAAQVVAQLVAERERQLRAMTTAHRFEAWLRRDHERMRTEWTPAEGDSLHEFAAQDRGRHIAWWDEEIAPLVGPDELAAEAADEPHENLLEVADALPVIGYCLRSWLREDVSAPASPDIDGTTLKLASVKGEYSRRTLYAQLSPRGSELFFTVFPEVRSGPPRDLGGQELIERIDRLVAAERTFVEGGGDPAAVELLWSTVMSSLWTPLAQAVRVGKTDARMGVRARYALLYFGRTERIRRLIEAPEKVVFPDSEAHADTAVVLARRGLDALVGIDEAVANWRAHHVAVIARVLGTRKGTAGTGTQYLAGSLGPRGMPEIVEGIGRVGTPTTRT